MSTERSGGSTADFKSAGDTADVNRQRRLNAIHDARESVVDRRRKIDDALHYGEITRLTANTILRREVEHYIHEIEWLLDGAETSQDYWGDGNSDKPVVELGAMVLPDGGTVQFNGLQSIVETADPIQYEWTTEEQDEWDGKKLVTHQQTLQIPRDVLMNAYRAANGFLFEVGLDLTLDDDEQEFEFEYSDLIVPEESDE